MSFKNLLKLYSRESSTPVSNLFEEGAALPEGESVRSKLELLYKARRSGVPPKKPQGGKSIAICAIIVDTLHHESIWRDWIDTMSSSTHSKCHFFVHAKDPARVRSNWVRDRLIDISFRPQWNSPEVVRAMLATLDYAVKHSNADRFVFVTESCIPVWSLSEIVEILFQRERSWLNAYNVPKSSWEAGHCFEPVDKTIIPHSALWKALPGWIMLTRRHACDILGLLRLCGGYYLPKPPSNPQSEDEDLLPSTFYNNISTVDLVGAFGPPGPWSLTSGGVHAPEEVFFASILSFLGYLRSPSSDEEIHIQSISFAVWARRNDASPQFIDELSVSTLRRIRESGALFARKFRPDSRLNRQWAELVLRGKDDGLDNTLGNGTSNGQKKVSSNNEADLPLVSKKRKLDEVEGITSAAERITPSKLNESSKHAVLSVPCQSKLEEGEEEEDGEERG